MYHFEWALAKGVIGGGRSAGESRGRFLGINQVWVDLLWEGAWNQAWLEGACTEENTGTECSVSKLVGVYWHWAVSPRYLCV